MSPTVTGGRGKRRGRPSSGADDAPSAPESARKRPERGTAWSPTPLPRGRHKLPQETVQASQRERLLGAMGELVGQRGYAATTVPDVIAAARVSTNTFYRFFKDKTDCFIALSEQLGDRLFAQLVAFGSDADTPEEALTALDDAIRAYLAWWSDQPGLARAYFVELPMAGTRAVEERERQYRRFEAIHRQIAERSRRLFADAPPLRDVEVIASAILTMELVARHVRAGRVNELAEIQGDIRHVLLKLLAGDRTAQLAGR